MNIVVFYYFFKYNMDGFWLFCSNLYNYRCL